MEKDLVNNRFELLTESVYMQKNKIKEKFFGVFEGVYFLMKDSVSKQYAIEVVTELVERYLRKIYGNNFIRGRTNEFKRLVGAEDRLSGLKVDFPFVTEKSIVYRLHDNLSAVMQEEVSIEVFDSFHLDFKVKYILGSSWKYKIIKHTWLGDTYTEYLITKCKENSKG